MNPPELRYTKEHEWIRVEADDIAVIGITQFAAESLGDIVFLELAEVDAEIPQMERLGELESVKAVSDIYSPISGRVVAQNEEAVENPQLLTESPYDSGWLVRLAFSEPSEMDNLMTAEEYEAFLASQEE